jgi:hypothetical protein
MIGVTTIESQKYQMEIHNAILALYNPINTLIIS